MADLHLGYNFRVPDDAICETFAFLGKRGSGKTYSAKKLADKASSHAVLRGPAPPVEAAQRGWRVRPRVLPGPAPPPDPPHVPGALEAGTDGATRCGLGVVP